ncbi:MAG TPA: cystine ABC transporter permease [Magnetospirillaceae bacterium]|nr:cystine ABC transporter permease [Magnetospirillaceae bacterium]
MNLIDVDLMVKSVPFLLKGAGYTVELSLGGMFFGLSFGFVIALMRLSKRKLLRGVARTYVSFIRGTPLLVQLFVIYYGLAQFGLRLDPIPSALIGLSLNVAGYTGEILRAAIASIDKGQWEAARALGLSWSQTMRLVIVPQAARVALPPLGNSFIALIKDTSLAATIQVPELFRQAQLITARTFQIFTMYFTAAVLYWIISTALSWAQERLERRYSRQFQ